MDTGRFLKVPGQTDTEMDKYTASIELSNACRQFYQARLEAAHGYKSKWESRHVQSTCCTAENSNNNNNNNSNSNSSSKCKAPDNHNCRAASSSPRQQRQRNSIDEAMDRLRTEMTSLMDQDLSLMKQLLTLNETIEELKWQRRYYYSRGSVRGDSSSSRLSVRDSDGSISDTDMYSEVEDHGAHVPHAPPVAATAAPLPSVAGPPLSGQTPPPPPPPPVVIFTSPSASCSAASHLARKQGALVYGCGHVTVERAPSAGGSENSRGGNSRATEACAGVKVFHHSEQDSFDSGFHEPSSEEEAALVS